MPVTVKQRHACMLKTLGLSLSRRFFICCETFDHDFVLKNILQTDSDYDTLSHTKTKKKMKEKHQQVIQP